MGLGRWRVDGGLNNEDMGDGFGLGEGICGSGWTVMARGSFVVGIVLWFGLSGDDLVFDFGEFVEFVEVHLMLGAAGVFDGAGVVFVD